MGIRRKVRAGLVRLDRLLGIREWLRSDEVSDLESAKGATPPDPFSGGNQHPCPRTILDIGASHGQFALEALRAFPAVTIFSFEPIPECYRELLAVCNQHPTLHPLNLALSDKEGIGELKLSAFRDSSSLHEMLPKHTDVWPGTQVETTIRVPLSRLDTVMPTLDLHEPVFAKIDVQGHELAVIRGGRKALSLCQRVMLECNFAPLYAGQPSFDQIFEAMRSLDFAFDGLISPLRDPRTGAMMSADLVFFREAKR